MLRRYLALVVLGTGGLLVTPGAVVGVPDVPGDPTPPVVAPVIFGTLGLNGWYTSNVTVNWTVQDPESTILSTSGCDARTLTTDSVGVTLQCTAESDGGITQVTKTFPLDKTAPTASASAARGADSNGWYNRAVDISFSGSDATSGMTSCTGTQTYEGPDAAGASVSGSCRDRAGNSRSTSISFNYDDTAPQTNGASPSRAPDANGWYNHALTISFAGADATSGVQECTSLTYSGPDDPSTSVNGTCRDLAGNQSAAGEFTLKYDETDPVVTGANASRPPDANGWYNRELTVNFAGSDSGGSSIDTCTQRTYSGPDSGAASVSGSCRDRAGNQSGSSTFALAYDATAPEVTGTPSRAADANGWYNRELSVSFAGTDPTSGVASCVAPKTYAGPDTSAGAVAGMCTDTAGNVGTGSFGLKYDQAPPLVTPTPGRGPDANGWYNRELSVAFTGTDATSGVNTCTGPHEYSGPDSDDRLRGRLLHRSGGQRRRAFVRAQVRRDRPAGDGDALQGRRRERLVQPRAHGQLRSGRRHLGPRAPASSEGLRGS